MIPMKMFRSTAPGLPDLLQYGYLRESGIIQMKDGSLLSGFFYWGDDAAVASPSERNYLTGLLNTYLARLGNGWAIWSEAARIPSPGYPAPSASHFPEPITAMIDAERRAKFEEKNAYFETEYALIVQYYPPKVKESKLTESMYDDDGREEGEPGEKHLAEFKRKLADLEHGFGDLLNMRRMQTFDAVAPDGERYMSDELVNYLHFAMNGEAVALRVPDVPMYLDAWMGIRDLWSGDTPKLGEKFISVVAIEGMPGFTTPGLLDILDGLPLPYRWSTRFIFMEQHEAISALNRYRLKWQQKVRGFWTQLIKSSKGVINTDALMMMQEAETALAEAKSGLVAYGYYTPVIVLMHENRQFLAEQARYVAREVQRKGFASRIETVNCQEAWLGSLPGHPVPNIRRPLIHTLNLADLMPLSSVWPGLRENPCDLYPAGSPPLLQAVTTGETPFRLNLHVADVGHTLVFGPTGAGKSTLLATLLAQARRYRGKLKNGTALPMTITAFDKGRSLYGLCKATGGSHYDIGEDDATIAIAPLADIDTPSGMTWAEEWIATCFELQSGRPPSPYQKREIHKAMELLQAAPRNSRSLTDYVLTVQDEDIRAALGHYTISGAMGHLLDGKSDDVEFTPFTVFEIDELMKLGDKNAIPVLLYLFRRFEKGLHGQPAILSLDEAWVMLGHEVFRSRIREWLKELRKKNCLVLMATQSLSDAVNSNLLDVLLEQCPTKILLPNKEAQLEGSGSNPGPAELYRSFGLNNLEIDLLAKSKAKRDYYYTSPLGRRLFSLGLDKCPLAMSFVAVSDKDSIAAINELIFEHGADWPLAWLDQRGVNYAQYLG